MSAPTPQEIEVVLALAREAEPREMSSADLRRMVRQSVAAGSARRNESRQRITLVWVGATCAALLLLALLRSNERALAPSAERAPSAVDAAAAPIATWAPLELSLPSGDRLAASPGAQFELEKNSASTRRVALHGGSVVFAVRHLASGETFSVQTPHAYVEVRGTVFSVDVDAQRTRVRVHEGAVQVHAAQVQLLHAGERYGSDGAPVPDLASALERRALELVAERADNATLEIADDGVEPALSPSMPEQSVSLSTQARDAAVGPGNEPPALPVPEAERFVSLEQARALLEAGDVDGALAAVHALRPAASTRGEWLVLEGDALRTIGQVREAVDAYARAAAILTPRAAARAAFKAADLSLRVLDDPATALRVIDQSSLDAYGAPLRERALLLRIEASRRLGLPLRELARRYIVGYPNGASVERLQPLADAPAP